MSATTIKKLNFGPRLLGDSIPGWKNTTIRKFLVTSSTNYLMQYFSFCKFLY